MSCNGCRVLRKGCSESCVLRPCLQWIESPEAQGNATVFVAKFFGRAGLMSFISAVPENQRPALFQSLLLEACGRTVNPVNGAVGLLWAGNWHVCQAAMETVLRGGTLRPISKVSDGIPTPVSDYASEVGVACTDPYFQSKVSNSKRQLFDDVAKLQPRDLDLCLSPGFSKRISTSGEMMNRTLEKLRPATPSMNSEESVTTSLDSGAASDHTRVERKLLNLFV